MSSTPASSTLPNEISGVNEEPSASAGTGNVAGVPSQPPLGTKKKVVPPPATLSVTAVSKTQSPSGPEKHRTTQPETATPPLHQATHTPPDQTMAPPALVLTSPTPVKGTPPPTSSTKGGDGKTHHHPPSGSSTPNSSRARTAQSREEDLRYLSDHQVCQTLEIIVKQLLRDRPQDPTLAICNMLRGCATGNPLRTTGPGLRLPPKAPSNADLEGDASSTCSPSPGNGALPPVAVAQHNPTDSAERSREQMDPRTLPPLDAAASINQESSLREGGNNDEALGQAEGAPADDSAATGSKPQPPSPTVGTGSTLVSPTNGPQGASNHSIPRPTSSSSNSSSVLRTRGVRGSGYGSLSLAPGAPHSASSTTTRRSEHTGQAQTSPAMPFRPLERDESTKSEVSVFSVSSVDMQEFVAEFKAAHSTRFPNGEQEITRDDLADIVDAISLPLPDIRMLADLFSEIDIYDRNCIRFDVFLARLAYKIQGRFNAELVRNVFQGIGLSPQHPGTSGVQRQAGSENASLVNQKGAASVPAPTSPAAFEATPPAQLTSGAAGRQPQAASGPQRSRLGFFEESNASLTDSPTTAALAPGGGNASAVPASMILHAPPPPAMSSVGKSGKDRAGDDCSAVAHPVARKQCLEEGLRTGLGLRISEAEYTQLLARLGLSASSSSSTTTAPPATSALPSSHEASASASEDTLIGVNDFFRIVTAITGQPLEEVDH